MPDVHMLKAVHSGAVLTRCGEAINRPSGQSIASIGVTGRETRVTCPGCKLPPRVRCSFVFSSKRRCSNTAVADGRCRMHGDG